MKYHLSYFQMLLNFILPLKKVNLIFGQIYSLFLQLQSRDWRVASRCHWSGSADAAAVRLFESRKSRGRLILRRCFGLLAKRRLPWPGSYLRFRVYVRGLNTFPTPTLDRQLKCWKRHVLSAAWNGERAYHMYARSKAKRHIWFLYLRFKDPSCCLDAEEQSGTPWPGFWVFRIGDLFVCAVVVWVRKGAKGTTTSASVRAESSQGEFQERRGW